VGDHHHGHAFPGQSFHDIEHLVDHLGIQGRSRLVEEHDLGAHRKPAGDGDPLLLASGELVWVGVGLLGYADLFQKLVGVCLGLLLFLLAHVDRGEGDVLKGRHVRVEVELLEYEADLLAHAAQVDLGVVDGHAVDVDLPILDGLELVDAADQRALARA